MRKVSMNKLRVAFVSILMASIAQVSVAADWSTTQLDYQLGKLVTPGFGLAPETENTTNILTFQHASGWSKGDNFFFVDFLDSDDPTGFNNNDWYGEFYPNFSYSKIFGKKFNGPLRDVGFTLGLNLAGDPNVVKYLPGIRLDWNVPGFSFFNTLLAAYIDDSEGIANGPEGSAPAEDDSWIFDVSWSKTWANGKWSFAGHGEYVAGRDNEFGDELESWILLQPQIRYHFNKVLSAGIEYQYWKNKLGDGDADESAVQLLATWTF